MRKSSSISTCSLPTLTAPLMPGHAAQCVPNLPMARPGTLTHACRRFWHWAPTLLSLACVAGVLIRFYIKDQVPIIAAYYYATPPPILAAIALSAGGWWLVRRRWTSAISTLLLSTACCVWWTQTAWYRHPTTAAPGNAPHATRVMFWNTAKGALGWTNVATEIRNQSPDIVGLVEAGHATTQMAAFWATQLDGYEFLVTDDGITLLAKGEITPVARGPLASRGTYLRCEVLIDGDHLPVVIADFRGEPFRSRRPPMEALEQVVAPLRGQPVLLMGDFNTPTDSVLLTPLRRDYRNAFETAGDGYAPTWPTIAPVLTIDQMWTGAGLETRRCTAGWSLASDHRWLLAEIATVPQEPSPWSW